MKNHEQAPPVKPGTVPPKPYKKLPKAYCKKDLLNLYGVTYKTLASWLRPMASEIGPVNGHFFTAVQLEVIFETLGYPGE